VESKPAKIQVSILGDEVGEVEEAVEAGGL
jgi:hypothetical protein